MESFYFRLAMGILASAFLLGAELYYRARQGLSPARPSQILDLLRGRGLNPKTSRPLLFVWIGFWGFVVWESLLFFVLQKKMQPLSFFVAAAVLSVFLYCRVSFWNQRKEQGQDFKGPSLRWWEPVLLCLWWALNFEATLSLILLLWVGYRSRYLAQRT